MRISAALCSIFALPLLAACGGDAAADGAAADGGGGALPSAAARPAVQTATAPADPCEWIPASEVASVMGPLDGAPTRVRSQSRPTPDANGPLCLYRLAGGAGGVVLDVSLNGAEVVENAMGSMRERLAREASDGAQGARPPAPAANGWDYEAMLPPNTYAARQGHVGIIVAAQSLGVPRDKLAVLAARVRDRIPDHPIANPVDPELAALMAAEGEVEPEPVPSGPDPCALLTREEAEAVLGRLTVPPYRSSGDSPLADPAGKSCSYYTGGHRALVVNPEWSQGRTLFAMAGGAEGLVSSVLPGGVRADTARGPWEQMAGSSTKGTLYFLKGDRMLEIRYQSSSTNLAGAMQLARKAVGRL